MFCSKIAVVALRAMYVDKRQRPSFIGRYATIDEGIRPFLSRRYLP